MHYFLFKQLFSVCSATCFTFPSWQCSVCANYMHATQITFPYNIKNSYAPANAVCINQCSMILSTFLKAKCTKPLPIYQISLYFINSHYIHSQCQSFRFVKKKTTFHNIRVASEALVAIICGNRATNCLISCTVFSPWRSSNWEEINFALRLSAGPTALKFLSLKTKINVI